MAIVNPNILRYCLERLLRPVVRFCLRHGLKLQDVLESIKGVFVQVAEEEIKLSGNPVSVSRISVMTGVHRPDVMRLSSGEAEPKESKNQIIRIIGQWQHSKRFCTASGKPRTLEAHGKQSEFVELVRSVSADVNPYTVLNELERNGLIERTSRGVRLVSRMYLPKESVEAGFDLLSKDVEDIVLAVSENVLDQSPQPNLHIRTEYDAIPSSYAPEVRQWLLETGSGLHQKARKFLSERDLDLTPAATPEEDSGERIRVVVGTFARVEKLQK